MIKLIVLDFDGTIADTRKVVEKYIKSSLEKWGFKVNDKFLKALGNAPLKQLLHLLIDGTMMQEFLDEKIHLIAKDFMEGESKYAGDVKLAAHLELLEGMKERKIIMSNNVSSFVETVLEKFKIKFFDGVYGADKWESKIEAFKSIMKKHKVKQEEIVYIGDRPVDVKVAREVGCVSVAISSRISWSSRKDLLDAGPDYLISDLKDLKKIIEKINQKK